MTFAEEIEAVAGDEEIEAIVIGPFGWASADESDTDAYKFDAIDAKPIPKKLKGRPLAWKDVREYLNYNYNNDFGAPECHAIYAYTASKFIFVSEYGGSTHLCVFPRNPIACIPGMPGGG